MCVALHYICGLCWQGFSGAVVRYIRSEFDEEYSRKETLRGLPGASEVSIFGQALCFLGLSFLSLFLIREGFFIFIASDIVCPGRSESGSETGTGLIVMPRVMWSTLEKPGNFPLTAL